MLLRSRNTKLSPPLLPGIERKEWLKLLGITFHEDPCNWDLHIDSLLSRAASRLYILRSRESDLFNRITSDTGHVLYDLLPSKRNRVLRERGHEFIPPSVKTERFKRAFVNRCLFKFIS
ncbi:unnamed protein product [Porites evermanni]|uniref:Uncharacterized protein n=1 Tax=Porites evermanni TaxID=104178 RepID=A0ABN8RAX8_9CNID|nr:unnamed protein product [Porites evermanni]